MLKRKQIELSFEQKLKLIQDREKGLSYRTLASHYNISLHQAHNIVSKRDTYTADYSVNNAPKRPKGGMGNPYT